MVSKQNIFNSEGMIHLVLLISTILLIPNLYYMYPFLSLHLEAQSPYVNPEYGRYIFLIEVCSLLFFASLLGIYIKAYKIVNSYVITTLLLITSFFSYNVISYIIYNVKLSKHNILIYKRLSIYDQQIFSITGKKCLQEICEINAKSIRYNPLYNIIKIKIDNHHYIGGYLGFQELQFLDNRKFKIEFNANQK